MTHLKNNMKAPDFSLSNFKLSDELKKGHILLSFYKKTCPTCQLAYPFLDKIHKHYQSHNFQVIGIGQDPETKEFSKKHGVTFKMISDTSDYAASKLYNLETVPTIMLLAPNGNIAYITVGFSKVELVEICQKISNITNKSLIEIFNHKDVPSFKPG